VVEHSQDKMIASGRNGHSQVSMNVGLKECMPGKAVLGIYFLLGALEDFFHL